MKRFVVGVKVGFYFHDNATGYEYKDYFFDTYTEARRFAARFPKGDTYLMDINRIPF